MSMLYKIISIGELQQIFINYKTHDFLSTLDIQVYLHLQYYRQKKQLSENIITP